MEQKVIQFMRLRTYATVLSLVMIVGSIGSLAMNGIKLGAGLYRRYPD